MFELTAGRSDKPTTNPSSGAFSITNHIHHTRIFSKIAVACRKVSIVQSLIDILSQVQTGRRILAITVASSIAFVTHATAQTILSSKDGTFMIQGTLDRYENGFYVLGTPIGQITIHSEAVDCKGENCPEPEAVKPGIRIAVSDNFNPRFASNMVREFYAANELGVKIAATDGGASLATIAALDGEVLGETELVSVSESEAFELYKKGEVDVVFSTRRQTLDETATLADDQSEPSAIDQTERVIGGDAVVIAVSPENPIRSLTVEQVIDIFSGHHKNWSEVGGGDLPITVYAPPDGSPVTETFRRAILDGTLLDFDAEAKRDLNDWVSTYSLASNPGGIGLVRLSHINQTKKVSLVDACGMQSDANKFSVLSENYLLSQRIYAYTQDSKDTFANRFVDFVLSPKGQEIMNEIGYVGIEPEIFGLDSVGSQFVHNYSQLKSAKELRSLQSFTNEILEAERMSISFRFGRGSSQLDKKARADIDRLTELLTQPAYQNAEILLVGFTDSIGKTSLNDILSKRRAEQVLAELQKSGGDSFKKEQFVTLGYGESFPVSCNEDELGRNLNRRVEVWLR